MEESNCPYRIDNPTDQPLVLTLLDHRRELVIRAGCTARIRYEPLEESAVGDATKLARAEEVIQFAKSRGFHGADLLLRGLDGGEYYGLQEWRNEGRSEFEKLDLHIDLIDSIYPALPPEQEAFA